MVRQDELRGRSCTIVRVSLTIREIVRIPNLRTRVYAGRRGEGREVRWAGVCELPDPTEWLGDGDLLMTVGLAIPRGAAAQRQWIEHLAGSGLSGIALCESGSVPGDGMRSPPLTDALRETADELGFPVLMVEHQVPFVALAHAVTDASSRGEHERLVKVMRLYESLRSSRTDAVSAPETLASLAETCRCDLRVIDRATLRPPFGGWPELTAEASRALADLLAERTEPLAAWVRFEAGPAPAMALLIPTKNAEVMVAVGLGEPLDPLLLQHAATIMAIEVERSQAERERARRLGGDLFRRMLEGRVGHETAAAMLVEHGCGAPPWIVAATGAGGPWPHAAGADLHARLDAAGIPCLELEWGDAVYRLLEDAAAGREAIAELARELAGAGISGPFTELEQLTAALRDARWALGAAVDSGVAVVDEIDDPDELVTPRSVAEAELLVERVIGPLQAYDRSHRSELERTLEVFLEENRSWQRAAARLHVHKQTLVYRIRQIEALTGRDLTSTADVARLWLALEASRRLVLV
jgi:Purine catabolism regulatory protein-like family/PucR C-terminal helix-turn-helix domain